MMDEHEAIRRMVAKHSEQMDMLENGNGDQQNIAAGICAGIWYALCYLGRYDEAARCQRLESEAVARRLKK